METTEHLITCEHKQGRRACKMQFRYPPEHAAAGIPRMCGEHRAEYMRHEQGLQGHPEWSVD